MAEELHDEIKSATGGAKDFIMADKKEAKAKQLSDEELKNVNSGMKIVVDEPPSFWNTLLRFFFGIKK